MEDVKWMLRRFGFPILLLLICVIVGVICWGKMHEEEQKVAEEVWEPPVEMENSEVATEADADTSTESAYWFVPQASDCLISDEESEGAATDLLDRNSVEGRRYARNTGNFRE